MERGLSSGEIFIVMTEVRTRWQIPKLLQLYMLKTLAFPLMIQF